MKKSIVLLFIFILLLPLSISATGKASLYRPKKFFLFYVDSDGNRIKDAVFKVENYDGEKIGEFKASDGYFYDFYSEYNNNLLFLVDYGTDEFEYLLKFFDSKHREIIRKLVKDDTYVDPTTYNEYIANIELDDVIFAKIVGEGQDNFGLFGYLPIRIIEETDKDPIVMYSRVYYSVEKVYGAGMELSLSMEAEFNYIDVNDKLKDVHYLRFKELIDSKTYDYYYQITDAFNKKYLPLKTYGNYDKDCDTTVFHEEIPVSNNTCWGMAIYKNVTSKTIYITDSINLNDYYKVLDASKIQNIIVDDPSILEVKDGVIVPLKVGSTRIRVQIDGDYHILHIDIKEIKNKEEEKKAEEENPKTRDIIKVEFIALLVSLFFILLFYILFSRKQIMKRH